MGLMAELNDDFEDFVNNVVDRLGATPVYDITVAEMTDLEDIYHQADELLLKYYGGNEGPSAMDKHDPSIAKE